MSCDIVSIAFKAAYIQAQEPFFGEIGALEALVVAKTAFWNKSPSPSPKPMIVTHHPH
jgi:hypothetical protein